VVAPLVALVAFLVGGTAAALLARAGTRAAGHRLRLAMAAEIGLLGGAAVLAALVDVHPGGLTAFASESELTLRATAIGAILAGAIAGALLLKGSLALALAAAAAVVVAAAVSERTVERPYTGAVASSRSISSR
jgi:hypothetical protein